VAALSGVKSVKHVSVTIPGGQADGVYTTTISAVDTSKTILLFTGCSCSTFDVQAMYSYMTLTNSTTVTARRWVGSFADHVANCCVVEFYGGIKSIQRGVIDVPRNTATKNTTINAVTTAKTFVTWGGACTEKPSADNKLRPGRLYLSSTTNLYYYSNCTSNYPRHLVAYEVVEWE